MRNDALYMVVPFGIGDAMILCGLKKRVEESYGAEVIPVIKASHEIVMRMYGITEYIIGAYTKEELTEIALSQPKPAPGKLFVAHPAFGNKQLDLSFLNHEISFVEMFCRHFRIENYRSAELPLYSPKDVCNVEMRALEDKLGVNNLEDIVLIAPEMKSASETERIQDSWYIRRIEEYKSQGYKIIVNCDAHSFYYRDYAIDMSLDELALLGANAGMIISARSGFCDLIHLYANYIDIMYPNRAFLDLFSMESLFGHSAINANEITVSLSEVLKKREINTLAIYAYGNVGRRVHYSLKKEGFEISYVIDKKAMTGCDVQCYKDTDVLPPVDAVIITISDEDNQIKDMLRSKGIKSLSLSELMALT